MKYFNRLKGDGGLIPLPPIWHGRCNEPPSQKISNHSSVTKFLARAAGIFMLVTASFSPAAADEPIMAPGDAVVTGFSGLTNFIKPDPLDGFFIDPNGPSMQIFPIGLPEAPNGQHLNTAAKFSVKAEDVGQVFAITFAAQPDALPNIPPDIFLGASSAFGLQIVKPDEDGDGKPERLKKGDPLAEWMEGQFGAKLGGEPGSIFRVDGTTGDVSLFATIPENSGPGIGDVVFDKRSRVFYASDLDTGLIHRISEDGTVLDAFDHGIAGRTAAGLGAVADDGKQLDIKSPAFDPENSDSWGLTQEERRIWGMAVNGNRLYYAVWNGPQIWSVGLTDDGSFADDARKEFDVDASPSDFPVSDLVFDATGRLYLAQRGGLKSSYDYSSFAMAKESNVLRYSRDKNGKWILSPEDYAIGFPHPHKNASGGIDLGLSLERFQNGLGACDASLWSTGDALRDDPALEEPRIVHGLQGNEASLVTPDNTPPVKSVFVDYDGKFNDPQAEGHVGDVEIWQPCENRPNYGDFVPPIVPPFDVPGGGYTPDPGDPDYNLTLEKIADPKDCFVQFGGWMCFFTITVTNTGGTDYAGPITVRDWLPAAPAGAAMDFHVQPVPWTCNPPTPALGSDFECTHAPVLLNPGDSVELFADVWLPADYPKANNCRVRNNARIVWPVGFGDSNPLDDMDSAIATIPSDECEEEKSDLILEKYAQDHPCGFVGGMFKCLYMIDVFNTGPEDFNGNLVINDTVPAGTTISNWAPNPPWNCVPATGDCTWPGASIPAGTSTQLFILVDIPPAVGKNLDCRVKNTAKIKDPLGGSDANVDPTNDEDSATAFLPPDHCDTPEPPRTNLKIFKRPAPGIPCLLGPGIDWCTVWDITVINTGPGVFNDFVKVKDIIPAGATFVKASAGWNCVGTSCRTNAPVVLNKAPPSGDKVTLRVLVQGDKALAKQLNCKVTNKVEILEPLGAPKNVIPGDDKAEATQDLPPHLCDDNVPIDTNLKIVKRVVGHDCIIPQGKDWCRVWEITVTNTGPGVFHDFVEIEDTAPAGVNISLAAPGWTCLGNKCKTNAKETLNPAPPSGDKLVVKAVLSGSAQLAQDLQCKINNIAAITAPLGAPQNTNPGDDKDNAIADISEELCDGDIPQKSNLLLRKKADPTQCVSATGGWQCSWVLEIVNTGPGTFSGPVEINETLPGEPVDASWNASWNCEGVGGGGGAICKHPAVVLNNGASLFLNLTTVFSEDVVKANQCRMTNLAEIAKPTGGTNQNTNPGDDTAQATASVPAEVCRKDPPKCPPGYEVDDGRCIEIGKACPRGWTKTPIAGKCCPPGKPWNGQRCGGGSFVPPVSTPDPVTPSCPRPWKLFHSYQDVPKGWQTYVVDAIDGQSWYCARPKPRPVVECPDGWRQIRSGDRQKLKKFGWSITSRGKGKSRIWCGKPGKTIIIDPPKQSCAKLGKLGKWPRCYDKPVTTKPTCAKLGKLGKWPRCYDKPVTTTPTCAQLGKLGKWPRCYNKPVKPKPTCAQLGKLGKWPRCYNKPVTTKPSCAKLGKLGKWPRCYNKPTLKPNNLKLKKPKIKRLKTIQAQPKRMQFR